MADIVFVNGKIYTMDKNNPRAEAVGVKGNKIVKVGTNEELLNLKNGETSIIDLEGKSMVPGFNDSHIHLLNCGYAMTLADLKGTKSIDDICEKMTAFISINNIKDGDWVLGRGWNQDYFLGDKVFPSRYDLDRISKDHPIMITRACGHVAAINSKAIEELNMDKEIPNIEGGEIDLDDNGQVLGLVRENAIGFVKKLIPSHSIDEIKKMIKSGAEALNKEGITSVGSDDFGALPGADYEDIIQAYRDLSQNNEINMRVYEQVRFKDLDSVKNFYKKGYKTGLGDERFKIGPLKLMLDGSLGARTAALNGPYKDDENARGVVTMSQEALDSYVQEAHDNDSHVAIHGIGDRSIYMSLEAIEKAMDGQENKLRHGIVHVQITDDYILDKLKDLNVLAYIQPIFLDYDWNIVKDRVGEEREKTSYNWKRMVESGVPIACGSDAPVETFNVLKGIYQAVTRKDLEGKPEQGWLIDQALTVDEAIYGYTMGGAYASFEEDIKGSIEVGKLADMVVLSQDIKGVHPDEIKDIKVDMTIFDGKIVN